MSTLWASKNVYAFFVFCSLLLIPKLASALTVTPSGAVDVNALWEAGKAPAWYIEEQRDADTFIQTGVLCEDDAMIQLGLKIYDWGFAHQAADGSFAGTGDPFHSTSLFVEAVGRSMLLLKNYQPVTYSKSYSATVAKYTTKLKAACAWLTRADIAAAGQKFDQPYTHRRWLLAAALGQTASLDGDTNLAAAAVGYAVNGLALQLSNGVNPELNGYDVEYQCTGIRFAYGFYSVCADSVLRGRIQKMIGLGLAWEAGRINVQGILNASGSTRVGIETNRDGTIKLPTMSDISATFTMGNLLSGLRLFSVVAARISKEYFLGSTQAATKTGAVGSNAAWEAGQTATNTLGLQRYGADWIEAGVDREDGALIQTGITILNWGFARESDSGSFAATVNPFYNTAQFVEAAARATDMLRNYHPVTYTLDTQYNTALVAYYTAKLKAATHWLTRADVAAAGQKSDLPYASHRWLMAAALSETARITGEANIAASALPYAIDGLSLQRTNGVNPESGTSDVNYQAIGILYAERYYPLCTDAGVQARLWNMINLGLQWETTKVSVNGDVNTQTTDAPSYQNITQAFYLGCAVINKMLFHVDAERIDTHH